MSTNNFQPGYRKPGQKAVIAIVLSNCHFTHPEDIQVTLGFMSSRQEDKSIALDPSIIWLDPENEKALADAKDMLYHMIDEFLSHMHEGRDFNLAPIYGSCPLVDEETDSVSSDTKASAMPT